MVSSRAIRVHESFISMMGHIGKPIAEKIKKDYGLSSLEIDHPTMSEIVAGKLMKKKEFNFRIHRLSRDRGKLILM